MVRKSRLPTMFLSGDMCSGEVVIIGKMYSLAVKAIVDRGLITDKVKSTVDLVVRVPWCILPFSSLIRRQLRMGLLVNVKYKYNTDLDTIRDSRTYDH